LNLQFDLAIHLIYCFFLYKPIKPKNWSERLKNLAPAYCGNVVSVQ